MTDEELRDKIGAIYNRSVILTFLLQYPVPLAVKACIVTLIEDLAQDAQEVVLGHCVVETT